MKLHLETVIFLGSLLALPPSGWAKNFTGCDTDRNYELVANTTDCAGPLSVDAVTACDAMAACAQLGEALLGPAAYKSLRYLGKMTSKTWVGITDAAVERDTNLTGWQLVPGMDQMTDLELWHAGQPNDLDGSQDCTLHLTGDVFGLHDMNCQDRAHYRCQRPAGDSTSKPRSFQRFYDAPILHYDQDAPGCNLNTTPAATDLLCALSCSEQLGCVGFYHNAIRRECLLMLFFDAALKLKFGSLDEKLSWKKMLAFDQPKN